MCLQSGQERILVIRYSLVRIVGLLSLNGGWWDLHSWNKRTIYCQRSAVEGLVHVDDGIETEGKGKEANRQKVLLASMRPTRPAKNNQKYGIRARTADSSIWYALSRNSFSHPPPLFLPSSPYPSPLPSPFHNNFPELIIHSYPFSHHPCPSLPLPPPPHFLLPFITTSVNLRFK
jgi:hypothetical protein